MTTPVQTETTRLAPAICVADALAQTLAEWGVGAVYGVSGANIEDFHDAIHRLDDTRLTSVPARSENGASFMADAHARVHGGLGVCCSTSGGGMMNLAVGVAEAYQEGVPVLAIVGQVPSRLEGLGGFQDSSGVGNTVDASGMWNAISKEVRQVQSAHTIWKDLLEVVDSAVNGRKGPGVLLIPKNVFSEPAPLRPVGWPTSLDALERSVCAKDETINFLADQLKGAERPVIIAGPMVRDSEQARAVHAFAKMKQIPVVTTLADVGAFPNDDPLYLGTIGTAGHPSAHRYLNEESDLLIAVGTNLELMFRAPISGALGRCQTFFVNTDTSLAMRTFPEAIAVTGNIEHSFNSLMNGDLKKVTWSGRPKGYNLQWFLPQLAAPLNEGVSSSGGTELGLLQSKALGMLHQALPKQGQIMFDAGNCAASALHYMKMPADTSTRIALGMGGMGYAIAGAIGAQLGGQPKDRTVVICGDGAFLMLGMEVHTAVDLGLPVLFVVFNNGKHGMCVTRQQLYFKGRIECTKYERPSIAQIARGFGDPSSLWVSSADSETQLQRSLDNLQEWDWSGPAVLEISIGAEEVPPFTPFLPVGAPVGDLISTSVAKKQTTPAHAA